MTTVAAFNSTLHSFLEELVSCTPASCAAVAKAKLVLMSFDTLTATNPSLLMDEFLKALTPHAQRLMTKDETLFGALVLPGGVDLQAVWDANPSPKTREAVWQYLQMLFLLGTAASSVPTDMLAKIEDVAKEYAGKVNAGDMDFASVANMFMSGGALGGLLPGLPPKE